MMLEESASVRSVGGHVRHRCTRSQRALAVVAVVAGLVSGLSGAAGAAGILPPGNPSANIPPSNGDFLISIDNARAEEGVGPMDVNEAQLTTLPAAQQLFIVLNEERIDRGLAPIEFMTAQLDAAAAQAAQSGADPALPSSVTGGAPVAWLHRDIILHAQPSCGAQPSTLSLGAAADPAGYSGGSFAAELIASC